jgi:F-type H+-transporting ATPase subunit alpha
MPVEGQVMIIFAAVNGFLDDVPVKEVRQFEHELHDFMRTQHPEVGQAVRSAGKLDDELTEQLKAGLDAFKEQYRAEHAN